MAAMQLMASVLWLRKLSVCPCVQAVATCQAWTSWSWQKVLAAAETSNKRNWQCQHLLSQQTNLSWINHRMCTCAECAASAFVCVCQSLSSLINRSQPSPAVSGRCSPAPAAVQDNFGAFATGCACHGSSVLLVALRCRIVLRSFGPDRVALMGCFHRLCGLAGLSLMHICL